MKRLISVAAVTLSILSLAPAARAHELPNSVKVTHLSDSGARPDRAYALSATHYFKVHIEGRSLSQISVALPKVIKVKNGVVVTDQAGQKLDTTSSVDDRRVIVDFAQPVSAGTNLLVSIEDIKSPFPRRRRILLYPVYTRSAGMTREVPLGLARIDLRRS